MANLTKIVVFLFLIPINCSRSANGQPPTTDAASLQAVVVGAERSDLLLPQLEGKTIGMVVNHTSRVGEQHLVDYLLEQKVAIQAIFAPEHGFRGEADAGAKIKDGKDPQTGLSVLSLYGKKRKPAKADLEGIDLVVFDIQDVGARFYTYISTMHYVMEACAEQQIPFLVLDRPNPNGHYVDGPILSKDHTSFVGMHPVPVVHGMTVGEYAQMINGEGWLANGMRCALTVIPCANYTHQTPYDLPLKPSPNLPNMRSIYLYPSLCFFEGTVISVGRGTQKQFQVVGHPDLTGYDFSFSPTPQPGARYPKHQDKTCYGIDLSTLPVDDIRDRAALDLGYLIALYQAFDSKENFFLESLFFDKLAGGPTLRQQIQKGMTAEEIRKTWIEDLVAFRQVRARYLLYTDK
jgi:uncharacterized protein YbbC (DUF1343 family)